MGTHNENIFTAVKSTTEHLTLPELLGRVKSYNYLPPGWENVEVIADLAIGQNSTSLQSRLPAMAVWGSERLLLTRGVSGGTLWGAGAFYVFSREYVAVESWSE
ncbi:MAG: hypothetical protein RMZ43_018565 [Nostoc sp. CmiVER01]|uniref:hypothetical protein n=1 Tax=Nostoc sp. CmiVER01 TaxID=3075384 RepID=UPI002AD1FF2E|nr:hypothetical protein [Nostoc sp. CmiVER01]MDZ8126824.1 hypothetical protein [Nostoc sp. CmiVER01]